MTEFAKGVNLKTVTTKYGEIIKVGIKLEDFCNNKVNDRGYINFDIKRGKESGKPYAEIDTYKQDNQTDNVMQFDDDEIPF